MLLFIRYLISMFNSHRLMISLSLDEHLEYTNFYSNHVSWLKFTFCASISLALSKFCSFPWGPLGNGDSINSDNIRPGIKLTLYPKSGCQSLTDYSIWFKFPCIAETYVARYFCWLTHPYAKFQIKFRLMKFYEIKGSLQFVCETSYWMWNPEMYHVT